MKYSFSSHFLKVVPPATSFNEAWECLCLELLQLEFPETSVQRLMPPDRGIDLLRGADVAYQCKSTTEGEHGSISHGDSIKSLETALQYRNHLGWSKYLYATNAFYTGSARGKILDAAKAASVDANLDFLGPNYWDTLCQKHLSVTEKWLSYRIRATEAQIEEAFRKARYFDRYVDEFIQRIQKSNHYVTVSNNRTPIKIEIPFSKDLTIENLLDVAKSLYGIELRQQNFPDLGTSFGPRISLALDRKSQPFSQKIGDTEIGKNGQIDLWITIVWKDEKASDGVDFNSHERMRFTRLEDSNWELMRRSQITRDERRNKTLARAEDVIENQIWTSIHSTFFK